MANNTDAHGHIQTGMHADTHTRPLSGWQAVRREPPGLIELD